MKKKLSFVLVLALCAALLCISAWAAGETPSTADDTISINSDATEHFGALCGRQPPQPTQHAPQHPARELQRSCVAAAQRLVQKRARACCCW